MSPIFKEISSLSEYFCTLFYLILTTTLRRRLRMYFHPHFIDEQTEIQR